MPNLLLTGLNHKTAPVEVRERLAVNAEQLPAALDALRACPGVDEVMLLSTCNRVEVLAHGGSDKPLDERPLVEALAAMRGLEAEALKPHFYVYRGEDALRHLFRVASSLDSMVLGEPQILGQLKEAFEFALGKKTTGVLLNRLMKKAISVAKRVRTETRIAENAVSISFAAVELAKKIFTDLAGKAFMLLGAGEMAELAAKHMINSGVRSIVVANRTFETGCRLAEEFQGRAIRFDDFLAEMTRADIVICSTGAPDYVLRKPEMQKVMKERKNRPVFIFDISVPRNIDPAINDLENVYLYDVDDLQGVVDANVLERRKEAMKAETIIEEEIETFKRWLSSLDAVPAVVALREKAEAIKREEIEKALNRMPDLGEKERRAIEAMAGAIVNKLIHAPTVALKEDAEDKDVMIAMIKRLYALNGEDDEKK